MIESGRILGVMHAVVTVPDLDASLHFYRDLLGFDVTLSWEHDPVLLSALTGYVDPSGRAVTLGCPDGSEIELAQFTQPIGLARVEKKWQDAGLSFLTLMCSGIDEVVARLGAAGVQFVGELVDYPMPDGSVVRAVFCFAPEGTTITLAELPSGRHRLAPQVDADGRS